MRVLIEASAIEQRLDSLSAQLRADYGGRDLVCVGVLKGSFVFMADLVRRLGLPATIDFLALASYGNRTEVGTVRLLQDTAADLAGRHVLVVEDICDTGCSLAAVVGLLASRGAASVRTCVLLDKPVRRRIDGLTPDYTGFVIGDEFVVGYGLDYAERYRYLPYIAALDPADLEQET